MDRDDDRIFSEENDQLEAIARISRSQVPFERSLKELCMECILNNAKVTDNQRVQFKCLSPILRRDFLKRLEAWAKDKYSGYYNGRWTKQEFKYVFSLVQVLLDKSIYEFDSVIYKTFQSDKETWRLLAEKCPNLTQVTDSRHRRDVAGNVELEFMPYLLQLKNLKYIKLKHFILIDGDITQLVERFPDLRSLEFLIKFKHMNFDLNLNLFKLQKLEVLTLRLVGLNSHDDHVVAKYLTSELYFECIRHLPALQHIRIVPVARNRRHHLALNSKAEVLDRPLALRTLAIKNGFKGWTSDMLPHVTKLNLYGPLRDVNQFLNFKDLNSLDLCDVDPADAEKIMRSCQYRLEELKLSTYYSIDNFPQMDAHQIFNLCPKLKRLWWSGHVALSRTDLFPVGTSSFNNLADVALIFQSNLFPSSILTQIFEAPHLERLAVINLSLDVAQIEDLCGRLMRKEILQHFRSFKFVYSGESAAVNEALVHFLKLLPCYAPRLEKISFEDSDQWMAFPDFLNRVKESHILELRVPGFHLKMSHIDLL